MTPGKSLTSTVSFVETSTMRIASICRYPVASGRIFKSALKQDPGSKGLLMLVRGTHIGGPKRLPYDGIIAETNDLHPFLDGISLHCIKEVLIRHRVSHPAVLAATSRGC